MGGRPSAVRVTGPLAPYAVGFRRELERLGYRPNAASDQLRLVAHASRWLEIRGLSSDDLTPARVEKFLAHRRAEGYTLWLSSKAMVPMLEYLRGLGVVPPPTLTVAVTEAEQLHERYRSYLVQERALAAKTVTSYLHVARLFFTAREVEGELHLAGLRAGEVTEFVLAECASRSIGSAKYIVCGLRALLRYLYVAGHTPAELSAAVPKVACWRLATVPVTLGRAEVGRLLASCDRRTAFGRRDYAVLILLARLGLRAEEGAALELCDVDWRAGEFVVRGKGRRAERLPLPIDVGQALAGCLRRGRPRCVSTTVFTRVRAPHRQLSCRGVRRSSVLRAAAPGCRR